jgi:hypothetical protein
MSNSLINSIMQNGKDNYGLDNRREFAGSTVTGSLFSNVILRNTEITFDGKKLETGKEVPAIALKYVKEGQCLCF